MIRPGVFPRDNLFTRAVGLLYRIDTPTNVLPSMHVFNAILMWAGLKSGSGRLSRILETAPLSGRSLKEFSVKYPCAETIARNVRFSSEDLRSRLRCRPSAKIRIFALGADSARDKKILIAAEIF